MANGKPSCRRCSTSSMTSSACRGLVVFRGIAGFGDSGEVHASDLLRLNVDLPLVIEFFDTPKVVDAALALLDGLVPAGHILSWRAELRTLSATAPPGS